MTEPRDWNALRHAIEKASDGPWRWRSAHQTFVGGSVRYKRMLSSSEMVEGVSITYPKAVLTHESWAGPVEEADATFIATARLALPEMLALLEEAQDFISQSECGCHGKSRCWRCTLIDKLPGDIQ